MAKVLIIGPKFHYFNTSVERAFSSLGYVTHVLSYDNPVHPYNWINKVRYKFAKDKLAFKRLSRQSFQPVAEAAFQQFQPDLVFVMNGDMLMSDILLHWRGQKSEDPEPVVKPARVALWFFDSMTHIPLCEDNITAVDALFCYEQTDIPLIQQRHGVVAHFLPQAVDPSLYYTLSASPKSFDIVFAGDLVHSVKRRQVAQAIVAHYPHLRIRIWGEYKPWYKNPWRWLTRERRDIYQNRNATGAQLNHDYNASRIVLNIHHEQQKDGANPKVYEISATGAYQICDVNPYISQLFQHHEVGLYHIDDSLGPNRFNQLFRCIDEALAHDKQPQALSAQAIVLHSHTFMARMQEVIAMIQ